MVNCSLHDLLNAASIAQVTSLQVSSFIGIETLPFGGGSLSSKHQESANRCLSSAGIRSVYYPAWFMIIIIIF